MFDMRQCEFIQLLGGAAVYLALAARVQQPKRVVFLHALAENELEAQAGRVAFRQALDRPPRRPPPASPSRRRTRWSP
jgi:hypothetical protein